MNDSDSAPKSNPDNDKLTSESYSEPHDVATNQTEGKRVEVEEKEKEKGPVVESLSSADDQSQSSETSGPSTQAPQSSPSSEASEALPPLAVAEVDLTEPLEHSQQPQRMSQNNNLNISNASMNSNRSNSRSFSSFAPIRFPRSIQNSNWRENLSSNLSSVFQEFRPVFQPHNSSNPNRGIIANLSNYRIPSNSSFRYIDSPASESNPPSYVPGESFVINFDNYSSSQPHGVPHSSAGMYRSTNRPSLTDSLRGPEHPNDLLPRNSSGGEEEDRERDTREVVGPSNESLTSGGAAPHNEHHEGNLSETIAQIPEAASLLDSLTRYFPYVCILLAKSCYDHLDGILDFFALFVTFYHANKVVRQEVTKQNQRSLWNLLRALFFIAIVVAVIAFMLDKKNIPVTLLISGSLSEPFTLKSLMFAIVVNDLILKLITVAIKIVITIFPPSLIDYKGRGRIYLMTESISQFLRSLVTTHPWLLFLLDSYQGTEKIMGVILSGAYIVAKGSDLLQRLKFCKQAFLKLLQKVCIGVIPTKDQIQQAGGLCTICHDNFNSPAMLDCGHIFCELCIGTWLDRATVCPLCRAKISDDPSFRDGSTTFFIQLY